MTSKYILLFFSVFVISDLHAQKEKSFAVGLMFSPSLSASTFFHNSASVYIRSHKNEYLLGLDFYLNKIRGIGCSYQRHFLADEKKNHWYTELNLKYVKYASGFSEDAPFNYLDPSSTCHDDLVHENTFLVGSLSFGREFYLSKIFHFNISLGGGASWTQKELLECWVPAFGNESEEATHPEVVLKVGIGINVYRKVKQ